MSSTIQRTDEKCQCKEGFHKKEVGCYLCKDPKEKPKEEPKKTIAELYIDILTI